MYVTIKERKRNRWTFDKHKDLGYKDLIKTLNRHGNLGPLEQQ